jgi:ribosomal protein S10
MSNGRKARFGVVTHIRQIRLENPKPKAMACLVDIELPSGVEIRVSA